MKSSEDSALDGRARSRNLRLGEEAWIESGRSVCAEQLVQLRDEANALAEGHENDLAFYLRILADSFDEAARSVSALFRAVHGSNSEFP